MPELPEVHTTVEGLKETVIGLTISDVWTNYKSLYPPYKNQIKNPSFFNKFKKEVIGTTITSAERRHKNILIHLSSGKTILIHMKMTGHLMYGEYEKTGIGKGKELWHKEEWEPVDTNKHLHDTFNRHLRLVFTFSNNKQLVLSDMRKFAKVTLLDTPTLHESDELSPLGPEPLEKTFTFKVFQERILKKPTAPIKTVLMDQTIIAGIGNIYSDEILFMAGVHPESIPKNIPEEKLQDIFSHIKPTLKKGIRFGGDSTSDYRDITGSKGSFQGKHNAYRKTGEVCSKNDGGEIVRKVVRGRSAHFCSKHQTKY